MSFLKKVGKLAKTAAKAYITYQTGGAAAVVAGALAKRKGRAAAMPMTPIIAQSSMGSGALPMMMREEAPMGAMVTLASLPVPLPTGIGEYLPKSAGQGGVLRQFGRDIGSMLPRLPGPGVPRLPARAAPSRKVLRAMGMRPRYRRINPANGKAAMRAVRRIKATRKLLAKIERSLPKQRAHHYAPPPPFTRRRKR